MLFFTGSSSVYQFWRPCRADRHDAQKSGGWQGVDQRKGILRALNFLHAAAGARGAPTGGIHRLAAQRLLGRNHCRYLLSAAVGDSDALSFVAGSRQGHVPLVAGIFSRHCRRCCGHCYRSSGQAFKKISQAPGIVCLCRRVVCAWAIFWRVRSCHRLAGWLGGDSAWQAAARRIFCQKKPGTNQCQIDEQESFTSLPSLSHLFKVVGIFAAIWMLVVLPVFAWRGMPDILSQISIFSARRPLRRWRICRACLYCGARGQSWLGYGKRHAAGPWTGRDHPRPAHHGDAVCGIFDRLEPSPETSRP